jgi:hypothetical protein
MERYDFSFSLFDDTLKLSKDFIKQIKQIKLKTYLSNKTSFHDNKEESKLKHLVINEIGHYFDAVSKDLGFSKSELKHAWVQKYDGKGNYHDCHIHDPYLYSFILYVECSENSSKTVFYNPCYPYVNLNTIEITPKQGRCILFNGSIPHAALPNFDKKRLIVSGNIKLVRDIS